MYIDFKFLGLFTNQVFKRSESCSKFEKKLKKMEGTLFSLSFGRRGVINAKKERFCEFTRVRVNVQGHM